MRQHLLPDRFRPPEQAPPCYGLHEELIAQKGLYYTLFTTQAARYLSHSDDRHEDGRHEDGRHEYDRHEDDRHENDRHENDRHGTGASGRKHHPIYGIFDDTEGRADHGITNAPQESGCLPGEEAWS